jgi:hypothetical protein
MATKLNLVIDQGSTYSNAILVKDSSNTAINLSTYSVAGQIRKYYTSSNSTSFTATGNSSGYVNISLTANASGNLTSGRYVYDIEITSNTGIVTRVVEGIATITPQVTR